MTIVTVAVAEGGIEVANYIAEIAKLYGKSNVATSKSNLVDYYRYSSGLNLFPEVL